MPFQCMLFPSLFFVTLKPIAYQHRGVLAQRPILSAKRRRRVAIDIQFPHHFALHENGHHNFRLRFQRTRRYRGSDPTSSTTTVWPLAAAAPQIP